MKTLHWYLLRQVLATLIMTVAVFTFVLLLGNALKEIMALLISRQATLGGVIKAIGLLIPFVLVFALPMGMLTAALLVFGRFSADQELTAVRASGISLIALITPILVLSLLLCGLSAWINMEVAPRCRIAYKNLLDDMRQKVTTAILPEGRHIKDYPHYMFYIGGNDGTNLSDIYVTHYDSDQNPDQTIQAQRGMLETTNRQTTVTLFDAAELDRMENGIWSSGTREKITITPEFKAAATNESKPPLSDMTFRQLQVELREVEEMFGTVHPGKFSAEALRNQKAQLEKMKADATMPVRVQINRQVASSFACFGFTLVGIPLGIRAHRRETNMGFVMALILVLIYYSFIIFGQSMQTRPQLVPDLIVWLPNFIFQTVGAVMLWRANKGI